MIIAPDEIIKKAQKALKEGKPQASALTAIGMAYFEKGLLDKAVFHYQRALEVDPRFAPAYAGLGNVYAKKGRITESVFNLKEAIRLAPNCGLLYNWLGDAYFDQGKLEDAIREYSRATELNTLDSNAHNDLADAYRLRGDWEQALAYYRKTLEIDPGDTNAVLELTQVLLQLDRPAEARKILLELLEKFPDCEETKTARVVLASLCTQEGNIAGARRYLELAARDYPFNPAIQFHLGLCYLLLESAQEAMEHLQRAYDLNPENVRAARLLQKLRQRKSK